MTRPIQALTLWPEWAWAIQHLGKRVENRKRKPDSRLQPGDWFAIHAGAHLGGRRGKPAKQEAQDTVERMAKRAGHPCVNTQHGLWVGDRFATAPTTATEMYDQGFRMNYHHARAIICLVQYQGFAKRCLDPWANPDAVAWMLADRIIVLPEPIQCNGLQGLWAVPDEHQAYLRSLIA